MWSISLYRGEPLNLTFWDAWATMWDQYASKRDSIGHCVVILQLGKVKYWDGNCNVFILLIILWFIKHQLFTCYMLFYIVQYTFLGDAAVHNALFGTKIYINQDIPEIVEFRTRFLCDLIILFNITLLDKLTFLVTLLIYFLFVFVF